MCHYQKSIENKEQIIVGNNKFVDEKEMECSIQKINKKSIENQLSRLQNFKKLRDLKSLLLGI